MANLAAFYESRNMFAELTQFNHQLSYEEWFNSPRENKAVLLFVNFFSKMTQAWDKANRFDYIPGEDGVSTVCQYLEKNVSKIEECPEKYSEAYIYKVAYNCMYCICHDLKSVKDRWDNEASNVVNYQGEELSVFDIAADQKGSAEERYLDDAERREFWNLVEGSDPRCQKVVDYLLSHDPKSLKKLSKRNKYYNSDPLREVEVSLEEAEQIVEELREKLSSMKINVG